MTTRSAIRFLLAAAVAAALHPPAALLAGSGGSVYSRFGIGDLRVTSSTRLFALGGAGTAVRPAAAINDLNPAAWSGIARVRFTAGALYEGFKTDDGSSSVYLAGMSFSGFAVAVPLDSGRGITFGAGLAPVSRVNYEVTGPVDQAGVSYTLTRAGDGGISRVSAGLSARPFGRLSVAAQLNYYFGSGRYMLRQQFGGSPYAGASLTRTESVRGFGSTFGLLFDAPGGLAAGATLSATAWPTVQSERVYAYGAAASTSTLDTIAGGERSLRLPFTAAAGVSWRNERLLAALDLRYQKWEGSSFESVPGVRLKNALRISGGIEITRDPNPGIPDGRKLAYAAGLYRDLGYLEVAGESISETGITAGISFPIFGETRMSLAGSFAMRGTTDGPLQEDRIFRISASMDVSELWFQRPVEE